MEKEIFKEGDRITLNTGYACDTGTFVKYEGKLVVWKDSYGDIYKSPIDKYNITFLPTKTK